MELVPATSIYIDESNSTGENLLDAQQPVFSLSAVHLGDQKAQELTRKIMQQLPDGHGEPKYTKLSRTRVGRKFLLETFEELSPDDTRAYVVHKRFMAVTKIVDLLAVEVAADMDYNMYADNSALSLANLYHFVGPVLGGAEEFDSLLKSFVDMLRLRDANYIDKFYECLDEYASTLDDKGLPGLPFLQHSRHHAEDLVRGLSLGIYRDMLDPAIPCLVELAREAGRKFGIVRIVHDHAEAIRNHKNVLLNMDQLPDLLHPGKNLDLLPVSVIDFSDSQTSSQLQIADWVAGAARQWSSSFISGKNDDFAEKLEPVVRPWIVGTIWPDKATLPQ